MSDETVIGEEFYVAHVLDPSFTELLLPPTSDAHYGNHLFSKAHFMAHVSFIKDTPNAVTILNGDLAESALRTSKGDIYKQVGTPQDQRDWMIENLFPIKDKILGMTTGNHENRIYNETGIDISKDIAKELHVPYRPEGLMLKISFGDGNKSVEGRPYVYWVYFTHGYGGARTKSAKAVKVERLASWIDADVYIMCVDGETEILTFSGWRTPNTIKETDIPLTLNLETNQIQADTLQTIHRYKYKGDVYYLQNQGLDMVVSPEHRIIYRYAHNWLEKQAWQLAQLRGAQISIPRAGYLCGSQVLFTDDEIRLAGWLIAEGHFRVDSNAITITQKAGIKADEIRALLSRLEITFSEYPNVERNVFYITAERGRDIRHKLLSNKCIPNWAFPLNQPQFEIFLDALTKGDGYWQNSRNGVYYSKYSELIDRLQIALTLHGWRSRKFSHPSGFTGEPQWGIFYCKRDTVELALSSTPIKKDVYEGDLWCISTGNSTIIARRNGMTFITGNSHDHVVNVAPDVYLVPDARTKLDEATGFMVGRVIAHRKMLVKSNAFIKWGGYSEMGGFPPVDLETPIIKLAGEGKPRVKVEI